MDTQNSTTPQLAETLEAIRSALTKQLGSNLLSLSLYGSAARGLFQPGISDVNLLLILAEADPPALAAVRACLNQAGTPWRITPYLVTAGEWPQVVQAFPTRILEMQRGCQVLFGTDYLKAAQIDRPALALRTHQELLNVLLRFRHSLLGSHDPAILAEDLRACLPAFIKILRTLLYLRTGLHHDERSAVIRAAATTYGLSEPAFLQLLAWRQGQVVFQGTEWETAAHSFLAGMTCVSRGEHG